MSRDKYSNNHTIEIINESEDLTLKTNQGGNVSVVSGSNASIVAYNNINIQSEENNVEIEAWGSMSLESRFDSTLTSSEGDIKIETPEGDIRVLAEKQLVLTADWTPDPNIVNAGDIYIWANQNAYFRSQRFTAIASNAVLISSQGVNSSMGTGDIDDENIKIDSENHLYLESDEWTIVEAGGKFIVRNTPYIDLEAENKITIDAGSEIYLTAASEVRLESQGGDILLQPDDKVEVQGDMEVTGTLTVDNLAGDWAGNSLSSFEAATIQAKWSGSPHRGMLEILGNPNGLGQSFAYPPGGSSNQNRYVLRVTNTYPSAVADGIDVNLNGTSSFPTTNPGPNNNWMCFRWGDRVCGSIQGAAWQGTSNAYGDWAHYGWSTTSTSAPGMVYPVGASSLLAGALPTSPGNVQYVSSSSADFGEFFEAGNINEWDESWTKNQGPRALVGLPEGIVVWVVGDQFFKEPQDGAGVPMLITKRAIMVGSAGPIIKGSEDKRIGEVLSFIGKLPVLVKGAIGVGDLIVPLDDGNLCRGLPKSEADLQDYMKALGTALTPCPEESTLPGDHPFAPGEKAVVHMVSCAVGVK